MDRSVLRHATIIFTPNFWIVMHCKPKDFLGEDSNKSADEKALNRFSVSGKTALVTGAARGLALDACFALLEHGATSIIMIDKSSSLGDAADKLKALYPDRTITPYQVDVIENEVLAEKLSQHIIHITLAFAGVVIPKNILEHTSEDFRKLLEVNTISTFNLVQMVGRKMISTRTTGSIILMASLAGHLATTPVSQIAYSASKSSILSMTKSFASEWAPYDIRVNSISPGYMSAALSDELPEPLPSWYDCVPMKRIGQRGELNGAIMLLASDAGSFITGTDIKIDGGGGCIVAHN